MTLSTKVVLGVIDVKRSHDMRGLRLVVDHFFLVA